MHNIIVSVFPTYACNHNCNFCYLRENHNNQVLNLNILKQRLDEISKYFTIHKFNTYGGEITLLDRDYLIELNNILESHKVTNYVTSNLYDIDKLAIFSNAVWSTSLNKERDDYDYIKSILKAHVLSKKIAILSMISPSILKADPEEVLDDFRGLNLSCVSFIKYYPNISTGDVFNISQEEYENCLINLLKAYIKNNDYDYELVHLVGLNSCLKREYPIATNDQCIRIGPDGKLGAIYYNEDNLEYFKWYDNIEAYIEDCNIERTKYSKKCGFCKYYGHCWTEHITNLECDGCKNLLNWWKDYNNG